MSAPSKISLAPDGTIVAFSAYHDTLYKIDLGFEMDDVFDFDNISYNYALEMGGVEITLSEESDYQLDYIHSFTNTLEIGEKDIDLSDAGIQRTLDRLDAAIEKIEVSEIKLATSSLLLQTRMNFTEHKISALSMAGDKLTLIDPNEEAANLLAMQTREQIAMQGMSFALDSQRNILSLFR
ncbi:MAG: hypothetical protein ACTSXQ_05400 [Alphaproteobacteria bacterium]